MAVSALSAGLRCRCPNCGEGHVYRGFLTFKDRCEACGADLTIADAGDGPSFFVMFAALILIVPSAMFFEFAFRPRGEAMRPLSGVFQPTSFRNELDHPRDLLVARFGGRHQSGNFAPGLPTELAQGVEKALAERFPCKGRK